MSAGTSTDVAPPMLRLSEASPLLNIPVSTLRRLCAKGKVPGVKVGRSWRIKGAYIAQVTTWTPDAEQQVA